MVAMAAEERYLTVRNVAARLNVSGAAVRSWLSAGKLRGIRLPSDRQGWRIRESDLNDFMRQLESGEGS